VVEEEMDSVVEEEVDLQVVDSVEEDSVGEEDSAVEEAKYSWKQKLLLSPKTKCLKLKTAHR